MKRAPRSRQRHDLYAKYHDYDSEISDLLGECGILTAVSVFDSRTATVHVDATNELAYTPVPLKILAHLADACGLLKSKLTAEIKILQDQTPAILREVKVGPQTAVGKLLVALSAKTKVEAVEALAGLTPEQSAELKQLDSDLASDPVRAARSLQTLRTKIEEGSTSLANLVATASDQNIQNMLGLKGEFEAARSAAALASADLFSGEPLPNVGTPVWRTLWDAARRYSEEAAYAGRDFPVVGHDARCVLCHQELDTEASSRLGRFETFIQNESKKREEAARAAYDAAVDELVAARFSMISLRKLVSVIRDDLEDEALANAVRLCGLAHNWRLRAAMTLSADASLLDLPRGKEFDFGLFAAHVEALAKRAAALVTEKSSPERLAMVSRRDELAAREWLATVMADVIAQIGRLVAIDGLNKAAKATATNKITALSTQLAGSLVTHRLRARFAQEVDKFGVAGLAVELQQARSSAGIPYFHVRLISKPDKPVGEILSEGEHRCVALAAFMAELATTEATSSIVFDDPVSSLDHIHRDKVAARLAMESLKRQVIIFTHDIAFLVLLEEVCRATRERAAIPMAYRVVSRGADMAGFCNTEPPANVLPVEKVIPQMRKHLNNVKIHHERGDQASWRREVGSFEKELRESWERAVEEAVSPVIKRLSQKVYTDGLIKLTVLNETDCLTMREAFGRCSRLIHSQPGELNPKLPTPIEIEGEISALESWIAGVKVRQDAAK